MRPIITNEAGTTFDGEDALLCTPTFRISVRD
jgi:hypothetical protein